MECRTLGPRHLGAEGLDARAVRGSLCAYVVRVSQSNAQF